MQITDKIQRRNNVLFTELEGETVLLDTLTRQYFALNESGALIWGLLEHECSIQDLHHRIREQYTVDKDQSLEDIFSLLGDLEAAGLIRWISEE